MSVTSTGTLSRLRATARPANPAPTMTTCGRTPMSRLLPWLARRTSRVFSRSCYRRSLTSGAPVRGAGVLALGTAPYHATAPGTRPPRPLVDGDARAVRAPRAAAQVGPDHAV